MKEFSLTALDCVKCSTAVSSLTANELKVHTQDFKSFFIFLFSLCRHALVWTRCSSHIHGKEDREAACLCKHTERMPSLNLTSFSSLPTSRLQEIISLSLFFFKWHQRQQHLV